MDKAGNRSTAIAEHRSLICCPSGIGFVNNVVYACLSLFPFSGDQTGRPACRQQVQCSPPPHSCVHVFIDMWGSHHALACAFKCFSLKKNGFAHARALMSGGRAPCMNSRLISKPPLRVLKNSLLGHVQVITTYSVASASIY